MPRPEINDYTFYKIVNVNGDCDLVYVGSSCDMKQRRIRHKYNCNNPNSKQYNLKVYQKIREHGGWDEFKIVEIGTAEQLTLTESLVIEETYRVELKASMNTNRCITTDDEKKEQQKQYHIDNAEHRKEFNKQYCLDNAEKIKERTKQYYIDNADKINKKHTQYVIDNADKLKEQQKQYRVNNADKIKEKNKQYRVNNADKMKEKHTCECGGKYIIVNKSQHIKTAKHQNYLQHI